MMLVAGGCQNATISPHSSQFHLQTALVSVGRGKRVVNGLEANAASR
jgi:hypothetical protein